MLMLPQLKHNLQSSSCIFVSVILIWLLVHFYPCLKYKGDVCSAATMHTPQGDLQLSNDSTRQQE